MSIEFRFRTGAGLVRCARRKGGRRDGAHVALIARTAESPRVSIRDVLLTFAKLQYWLYSGGKTYELGRTAALARTAVPGRF